MPRLYILFILVGLMSIPRIHGQRLKFEHYVEGDGLSHNAVRHIAQDDKGFIWLGTFSGLNRFDGYSFNRFSSTTGGGVNTINNDEITALSIDEFNKKLWIGTRNGLTVLKLDTHQFTTFLPDINNTDSLPDAEVTSVYVDKHNKVWVGTKSKGLYVFYPKDERFVKIDITGFECITAIYEDKRGSIWIGSYGKGAIAKITSDSTGEILGLKTYVLRIPNSNEINPYVNFIYEDFKSDLFVGTRKGGLYKFDMTNNTFKNLYIKDDVIRKNLGPYFFSVAQAPDGKYWLGTLGGLIVCNQIEDIEKGDFQWHFSKITDDASLSDNYISSLYFDKSGVLWIGTEDGLDKYDPFENLFTVRSDISNYIDTHFLKIRGFAKTFDSKIIAATRQNGLFTLGNNQFEPLFKSDYDISSIFSIDGKTFYLGLWNGNLLVYNYEKNEAKIVETGIDNDLILTIAEYSDTEIIIGSNSNGVVVLNKNTFDIVTPPELFIPNNAVSKIVNDGKQNLWIVTKGGISKYKLKSKEVKVYTAALSNHFSLPENNVSDVIIDSNKDVWAATRKGLVKYIVSKDRFELIRELKEVQDIWITSMVIDKDDNLWLNLNSNKIAKYNIKLNKVIIYNINSGSNRSEVDSSKEFYNFDGKGIYLGGKNGIINFSPTQIMENKWSPAPVITRFKIDKSSVLPGQEVKDQIPLQIDLNYNKKVELDYNNRNFSIVFSAPSYSNQKLNKFQYMLEGFDEDWIETNYLDRTIQYVGLEPDDYVFKVKAKNSDGYWSDISSYNISISPTFWLSLPGIVLILIILSILIYFVTKQLKYRLDLKRALLMEKVKRERDEKLNKEKLRFFTNISHELRTPLTLIFAPVKQLLESNKGNDFDRSRINLIHQNANRLLRLVNQILDFRRTETGELKLKVVKTDVLSNTKDVFYSFEELALSKNINFNLNIESEPIECWIDIDKYSKILYNLLSNAMKFTENYGNVDLFIGVEEGNHQSLIIEVSDDGIGIPIESQDSVFKRFYQANNSKEITTGTGIGLSFVKALVEIHKGEIKLESKPKFGSIFTVKLPISKDCFDKSEIFEFSSNEIFEDHIEEVKFKIARNNTDIKQKILVLDDNLQLRKYLVEFLSNDYIVYDAENGRIGFEVCKKVKPVLCIVDAMMPEMDGFEFIQAIKNDDEISHTAVILLTALAENENRIKGYKVGVDGYLVKPFDPSMLKTRIESIIKIKSDLKQKFLGLAETDVADLAHSQIDVDFISQVNAMIEKNIDNPELNTKYLCDELGMSSSKLYRKIKQLTDLSPNEFIRTLRLKKGAVLLKSKKYNVSEVTFMVGFNDPLYFSRCFKAQFKKSPSTYINSIY
jgi:signal transduction histidine kinase/ligand-binding sensor domain-containing protein/DNA-binding response OmpR family regulator